MCSWKVPLEMVTGKQTVAEGGCSAKRLAVVWVDSVLGNVHASNGGDNINYRASLVGGNTGGRHNLEAVAAEGAKEQLSVTALPAARVQRGEPHVRVKANHEVPVWASLAPEVQTGVETGPEVETGCLTFGGCLGSSRNKTGCMQFQGHVAAAP